MTDQHQQRLGTLPPEVRERLAGATARVTADPATVVRLFAAAGRTVGRGPTDADDPLGVLGPPVEDLARVELLVAYARAAGDRTAVVATLRDLYEHGDGDERRAVLRALPRLDVGDDAVDLLRDALRTNDVRLVAAAMGPYATAHLDDAAWRHGVLKCLFVGVPLAAVDGLDVRRDDELVRMVRAYAEERTAAGRAVPADGATLLADADADAGATTS
jgi:hypothetical protein